MTNDPLDQATLEAVARVRGELAYQEQVPRGMCGTVLLADLRTIIGALQLSSQGDET